MYQRKPEQLQAMASVMRAPGGQLLWEMLMEMAADQDRMARKLEGPALYRAQGAAGALEQLADDMHSALQRRAEPLKYTKLNHADRSAA